MSTKKPQASRSRTKEKVYTISGKTRTGKKLAIDIPMNEAHIVDNILIPETPEARRRLSHFQSPATKLRYNQFVAEPRKGPAQPARAASKGMQNSRKRSYSLSSSTERQRAIDEVSLQNETRMKRNY
jgi:hypothetical protein